MKIRNSRTKKFYNIDTWPTLPTVVTINVVDEMEIPDYINADQSSM